MMPHRIPHGYDSREEDEVHCEEDYEDAGVPQCCDVEVERGLGAKDILLAGVDYLAKEDLEGGGDGAADEQDGDQDPFYNVPYAWYFSLLSTVEQFLQPVI